VPSIYDLKPGFQALLRPLMRFLRKIGITPNALTVMAILLSAVTGFCLWLGTTQRSLLLFVPIALFVRMALNALDGMMAREFKLSSPEGMILNELGDVISDTMIFLPLIAHSSDQSWTVILFAMLGILNEFTGVLAFNVCGERLYQGPMGKSDRAFVIGGLCLSLYLWPGFEAWVGTCMILFSVLLVVSTANRIKGALARARI